MKGDLHARDARHAPHLGHECGGRMPIPRPMRAKQHHAVSIAPLRVSELPLPRLIKAHQRVDPTWTIEVRPLIAHAQMHLDDAAADGLGIDDAGVTLEMPADPRAAIVLDLAIGLGVHRPMVEGAFAARLAGDVTPPPRLAVDDRDVRADMT